MAARGMPPASPLLAQPVRLDIEEVAAALPAPSGGSADEATGAASASVGPSRVQVYVSVAVLRSMPYFSTRLSDRWSEQDGVLYVRLPEGCTITAMTLLFERLHFPGGHWADVDLDTVLQMVQLAGMFLADGDGLLDELSKLLHRSVRCQRDIDAVSAFVARVEAPACVAHLAQNLARRRLSTMLGDSELTAMLKNVLSSGDKATAMAVEKILAQRSKRDAESVKRNANVLQAVLQVGPATDCATPNKLTLVQSESAGRWSEWVERPSPGLQHVLHIASNFILAHPEYLITLAPLMFPKFPVNASWTRSALLTDLLKRTIRSILDNCFTDSGAASSPSGSSKSPHARPRSGADEGEGLSGLVCAVIANGHEDLFHGNASLAAAVGRAASVSTAAVASLCSALLKLKGATLSSFVTSAMLRSIIGPSRQQLCLAILPNMHTLAAEVKMAVLAEIDADDSEPECSPSGPSAARAPSDATGTEGASRAPKRPRT